MRYAAIAIIYFACACGPVSTPSVRASADVAAVFFERFAFGDPTTDQSAAAPNANSTLVGTYEQDSSDVLDKVFAESAVKRAIDAGAAFYGIFNQCYSGGFLDDLARLGGKQSVMSAARHDELASYGIEPPTGVNLDSTDTFLIALGDGTARAVDVAAETAALNPFGPNPDAARNGEGEATEHPQYLALGGGEAMRLRELATDGIAILWAGDPAIRDGRQMSALIDQLVAIGYVRGNVYLLYGGGIADEGHEIVRAHMKRAGDSINLLAATRTNLVDLFAESFAADRVNRPRSVFMYVGDHGGLNGSSAAKPGFDGSDPLVSPSLRPEASRRIYGLGHDAFR